MGSTDEFKMTDFAFRTGNDSKGRDPIQFRVEGSKDGETWTVMHDSGENYATPVDRKMWTPWLALRSLDQPKVEPNTAPAFLEGEAPGAVPSKKRSSAADGEAAPAKVGKKTAAAAGEEAN